MKTRFRAASVLLFAFLLARTDACAADLLFKTDEPSLDVQPTRGMVVYHPPQAEVRATVRIVNERTAKGPGCLEIDCPAGGYVSVSFPLRDDQTKGTVRFFLRGEVAGARELFIGVQNFTMDGGFKTVSAVPLVFAKNVDAKWTAIELPVARDPAATRWQLTFAVRGEGRLWIDQLEGEL